MTSFVVSTQESLCEACNGAIHRAKEVSSTVRVWFGREIQRFTKETIPSLAQEIYALSKDFLTHLFWIVPYIALVSGNYADCVITTIVTCASGLDRFLDDEESSQTIALVVGAPLAVNIAARTIRLIVTGNAVHAVSLLFHMMCIAKLTLIAKGLNK